MRKKKFGLRLRLLLVAWVPLIVACIVLTALSVSKAREGINNEILIGLQGVTTGLQGAIDGQSPGDYVIKDGELYKGEFNISSNQEVLDNIVNGTDYEVTIFYGSTRMATTIVSDETGERIIGTDANDNVIKEVLENGNTYSDLNTTVNGKKYCVYYAPIKNASGETIGMFFTGTPTQEVEDYIDSIVKTIVVVAIVMCLLFSLFVSLLVSRIVSAVSAAQRTINELAKGNLDVTIDEKFLARSDELGEMQAELKNYIETMNDIVGNMHKSSEVLIESGKHLDEVARMTSENTEEINNAVGDISKGALVQAGKIEDVTAHVVSIGDIIQNIVLSVRQLDDTAGRMKEAGDESGEIIRQLSESNDRTTEAIERIGSQVYATNESVQSIKKAIAMIRSIAEETNLLSLNASIEAARAGEHGRGFAVVASEIQQLAEQSNESSSEIEEIIDALLAESEMTVAVMEEVKIIVEQQQDKLDTTKAKFLDVKEGIDVCRDETEDIQGQTLLCDSSREKVVDVIQDLSAISEENAASAEETNASMEELNGVITSMAEAAGRLMKLSEELDEALKFFKRG